MITRTVRGRPDEQTSGYLESFSKIKELYNLYSTANYEFANADNSYYFGAFSQGSNDGDPDVFTYSCGNYSGKFYLVKDGTQVKVLTVPYQKLKFDIVNDGGTLSGFKITTPDGVRYEYLESELSTASSPSGQTNYRSAWVLTKIVSPHGYGLGFEYDSHSFSYPFTFSESITIGLRSVGTPCSYSAETTVSTSSMSVSAKKLRKITSSNGYLLFTSSDGRTDINDKKLDKIELFEAGGTVVKSMKLAYEYFACVGGGTRLKLKSVTESDKDNCNLPATVFTYNELNVPEVNSRGQDHWGFYNGKDNNPSMVPTITVPENSTTYPGGDREPAAAFMQGGILTEITYPTGGNTSFEYEPHYASYAGTAQLVGGLRIRKIKFSDPVVGKAHEKWYSYPEGNLLFRPEYKRIVTSITRPETPGFETNCRFIQLTSTAMNVQGTEHVSYTKVEETDDQNGTQGKSVYYYSSESNYGIYTHQYPWVPGDERSKPNGLLLKTEQYNAQGTLVAYEHNQYNDPEAEPLHFESYRALKIGDRYIDNYVNLPPDLSDRYSYYTQRYLFVFYYINSRWSRLDKKTIFKDGQTTTVTYSYDPQLTFVRSETMKNSKEVLEVKEYKYAADRTTAPYTGMIDKYMLNNVVEEKETVNGTVARTVTTDYGDFGGKYLVQKVKSKIGSGAEYDDIVINSYDVRGNPTQYTEKNGIATKIDWHSSLGKLDLIQNRIVGFGGSLPQTTSYDYKPLMGISLQTDASGRKLYYNYDTFGRLLDVRENAANGNLLQSYTYKFGSVAGCTTAGAAITTTPNVSVPTTPGLIGESTVGSSCGAVTKVRFRWRGTDDNTRLKNAEIQGSLDGSSWTRLFIIPDNGINDWMTYTFSNSVEYKHMRFVSSTNGYGELRELEFYSGDVKLSGTPFGSSPNLASNPWQNAFDGDAGSMWHGANKGTTNFVGLSLGCATTCVRPDVYKTAGTTVCSSSSQPQTVTLLASGCPGNVSWYRNGTLIPSVTTSTYTTNEPGTYTAKCASGSCTSDASSGLVVTQTTGCDPTNGNQCNANLVKLLWRNYDHNRLGGATIQGSSNGVDWVVLYQFPTTASAPVGTWLSQSFSNPNKYPHIRYNARATDGVGDLKELRFYYRDANGNEYALTGTGFGSEPNLAGQGWANALDGSETTQWHAEFDLTKGGHPGNAN
ncbi:discoidin domain-containing protein, partial [Dyadobacter sp. BHUBP1]|uniref:discoidin domain-containing protein n=1 Tax=Dyadobacter sp. BHUBP1 TaxID=3424178 RepID=UPI003D352EE8